MLGGLVAGCGTTFKLPTENRVTAAIPGQGTYQRIATWNGMTNIQDILLTPGGELFLLFQDDRGADRRGAPLPAVARPTPHLGAASPGCCNPTARAASGPTGSSCSTRATAPPRAATVPSVYYAEYDADVDTATVPLLGFSRPITDRAAYWHVREYLLDGTPVSTLHRHDLRLGQRHRGRRRRAASTCRA